MNPKPVILASKSPSRAAVLRGAGVPFRVVPAGVDEGSIKEKLLHDGAGAREIGRALAREKARTVSSIPEHKGALVIGADQILECEGKLLDKPGTLAQAREHLRLLRGKTHTLLASVAIFENGAETAIIEDEAKLVMRKFSDAFLDSYLERAGEKVLTGVGAYQLEGEGAQLFETTEGDFFTILGLPLLPVLSCLRSAGALAG